MKIFASFEWATETASTATDAVVSFQF